MQVPECNIPTDDPRYHLIPAAQVRRMLSCSEMSLWRWARDPSVGLPAPIKINGRNFWRLSDVQSFIDHRAKARA